MDYNNIKLLFFKIIRDNEDKDKNMFYYLSKNLENKDLINKILIEILIYYKSFVNYNDTIFYIHHLNEKNFIYFEDTLNYIITTPYCRIVRYICFFNNKKKISLEDIYRNYNINFNIPTEYKYSYKEILYNPKDIMKRIKDDFLIKNSKYTIQNEIMDDRFSIYRNYYLDKTIFNRLVE